MRSGTTVTPEAHPPPPQVLENGMASPATPRTKLNVAIAALIGLVLGATFALALDRPRPG